MNARIVHHQDVVVPPEAVLPLQRLDEIEEELRERQFVSGAADYRVLVIPIHYHGAY